MSGYSVAGRYFEFLGAAIQQEVALGRDTKVSWAIQGAIASTPPPACRCTTGAHIALHTCCHVPAHRAQDIVSLLKKRLKTDNPHKQWLAVHLVGTVRSQWRILLAPSCLASNCQ